MNDSETSTWIDTFCRLLSSPDLDCWNGALELKAACQPEFLYKFSAPSPYALQNLREAAFWLSSAAEFNDTYDTTLTVDVGTAVEPSMRVHIRAMMQQFPGLLPDHEIELIEKAESPLRMMIVLLAARYTPHDREGLQQILDAIPGVLEGGQSRAESAKFSQLIQHRIRATCFSEVISTVKMWSHYADSHRGFCMKYRSADLAPRLTPDRAVLLPVRYDRERYDFTDLMTQFAEGGASAMTPWVPFLASIHKSDHWSEEREWRIVKVGDDDGRGESFPSRGAVAIYLGARMRDEPRTEVISIAQSRGLTVYEARRSEDGFGMEFDLLHDWAT